MISMTHPNIISVLFSKKVFNKQTVIFFLILTRPNSLNVDVL